MNRSTRLSKSMSIEKSVVVQKSVVDVEREGGVEKNVVDRSAICRDWIGGVDREKGKDKVVEWRG